MANNVQDMMLDSLLKASRAAEQITPAIDRAKAYTELAKACAMAIQTKGSTEIPTTETPKEVPKVAKRSTKKTSNAVEEKKEETKPEVPVKETLTEESQQEPVTKQKTIPVKKPESEPQVEKTPEAMEEEEYDLTTEWTPKAYEILDKEIKEIQHYINMFKNDMASFNAMVSNATEGVAVSQEDINPLNIRVILKYIKDLEAAEMNKGA